jgi:hypothetical protein
LDVEEDLTLSRDDRLHDDELEDSADDGTEGLSPESGARGKLRVLSHLKVACEGESLSGRVVTVEGEVHVSLRVAGDEGGTEHLGELLDVRLESGNGVDDADEGEPVIVREGQQDVEERGDQPEEGGRKSRDERKERRRRTHMKIERMKATMSAHHGSCE